MAYFSCQAHKREFVGGVTEKAENFQGEHAYLFLAFENAAWITGGIFTFDGD
nr:hypothetical protein [uncultured Desulfobacter sp.]